MVCSSRGLCSFLRARTCEEETFIKADRGGNFEGLKWVREQDPLTLTRSLRAQLSRSRVAKESEREGEEDSGTAEEEGETEKAEDEARD